MIETASKRLEATIFTRPAIKDGLLTLNRPPPARMAGNRIISSVAM